MKKLWLLLLSPLLASCLGYPETVTPVTGFQLQGYLGTWYEIARLDHSFERGLTNVTAEYTLREDGGLTVVNRGFSADKNTWQEASGKAYFVESPELGYLKVSFFGPFYGAYVVFELEDTAYAFVCSSNTSYLWFLSRTPRVSTELKERFVAEITHKGFNPQELIWVDQTRHAP